MVKSPGRLVCMLRSHAPRRRKWYRPHAPGKEKCGIMYGWMEMDGISRHGAVKLPWGNEAGMRPSLKSKGF